MAAISYHSPFANPKQDWRKLNSWMMAIVITVAVHSLLTWIPTPAPLQQQGGDDWRIISTVQFVQADSNKPPTPEVEKQIAKKTPIEKKPPQQSVEQPPELILSNKPQLDAKPPQKIEEPQKEHLEQPVPQIVEQPAEEGITTELVAERVDESESKPQEASAEATQQPLDTTKTVNNLTASLVNQPAGVPLAEYRSQIIERINANKSYPKTARRRGIQGDVAVSFTVADDGSIIDLECQGDAKILSHSACDAIKKSLPFPAPQQQQLQLSFVMDYVLR